MTNDVVETPMMKQFFDIKRKYPDAVLLFRCGDFYETYSSDAVECAGILGITLTRRANGSAKTVEMAGFPHHALDTYLPNFLTILDFRLLLDSHPLAIHYFLKRILFDYQNPLLFQ